MKYCQPCKYRAKDEDTTCTKCGGDLRVIGGPAPNQTKRPAQRTATKPAPKTSPQPKATQQATSTSRPARPQPKPTPQPKPEPRTEPVEIQFELAGLQKDVDKTSRRVKLLGLLAGVLAMLLVGVLFYLRHNYIMQFAEVDQLEIIASELHTGTARVRFRPKTAGRIQFIREGGGRQETLLEYAAGPSEDDLFKEFNWAGNANGKWTISIRYREGSSLIDKEWESAAARPVKVNSDEPNTLAAL